MNKIDVSVIIINFNTPILVKNCIESILKFTQNVYFEIILIDNNSSDNSLKVFSKMNKRIDNLKIIGLKSNIGFGRANNKGASISDGKYLFFLNSDTILLNNSIHHFFKFFEQNSKFKIGALGTILLDSNQIPTHSSGNFPIIWQFLKRYLYKIKEKKERLDFGKDEFFKVDYITGAALFMLKRVFRDFDGFDSDFFMYYEETDLQKRLQKASLKRILLKGPKIIHLEGMSTKTKPISNSKVIMKLNGMFLFYKKHNSFLSYYLFRILYFIFRFPVVFRNKSSKKEKISLFKILFYNPILNK